ncbi:MAG: sigma-70 family RNA polymerase sigma factor [Actinomycetota bacterium]
MYATRRHELVRLAYLMTGDAALAEEVVQDAFVNTHRHWDGIRDPFPYLRVAVTNGCRSWGRHQRVVRDHAPRDVGIAVDHPDELWDALGRLEPRRRAAIVLRFYADLPHGEIARILGCRPATVRTTIHRALRDLRREIKR